MGNSEALEIQEGVELKKYSTMGVGGSADYLLIAGSIKDIVGGLKWAKARGIDYQVIGLGANMIFTDQGFRGLIIINQANQISDPVELKEKIDIEKELATYNLVTHSWAREMESRDPVADYSLIVESGVNLEKLISWTLEKGLVGLEYYTGIPSTVGGAIYSNLHFANHLIGARIIAVEVLDENLEKRSLENKELVLGYDQSILRQKPYTVLRAEFALSSVLAREKEEAVRRRKRS